MAEIKQISQLTSELKKEIKEVKPQKQKIPKFDDPKPRAEDDKYLNNKADNYLELLRTEFLRAPFLALVEEYVKRCNSKGRTLGSNMHFFKTDHKYIIQLIFFLDFSLLFIFLAVILIIALRGLGLVNFSGYIIK